VLAPQHPRPTWQQVRSGDARRATSGPRALGDRWSRTSRGAVSPNTRSEPVGYWGHSFGQVRERPPMSAIGETPGQQAVAVRRRRVGTRCRCLGVEGSQVQILSARPKKPQVSTVTVSTSANRYRIPTPTADPTAAWVAEGAEIPISDPTLAELSVTPAKVAGLTSSAVSWPMTPTRPRRTWWA
jgi:hypothetical protein